MLADAFANINTPALLNRRVRTVAVAPPSLLRWRGSGRRAPPSRPSVSATYSTAASFGPTSGARFSYGVAASYVGKERIFDPARHAFDFDAHDPRGHAEPPVDDGNPKHRPRTRKTRPQSGQDSFFAALIGSHADDAAADRPLPPFPDGSVAFGVADGVGGWAEHGVDAGDFSHALCAELSSAAARAPVRGRGRGRGRGSEDNDGGGLPSALDLLDRGYRAVLSSGRVAAGGSTACVGVASARDGAVDMANLGDSGWVQLRLGALQAASRPQLHEFNTPFQLSVIPPSVAARAAVFGGMQLSDLPASADAAALRVRHGDVLVLATDGVWDNLFAQDVLRVVSALMLQSGAWRSNGGGIKVKGDLREYTGAGGSIAGSGVQTLQRAIAMQLVSEAKAASQHGQKDGPFAKEIQKRFPHENWHGGKVDDICVVVVVVAELGQAQDGEEPKIKSRL